MSLQVIDIIFIILILLVGFSGFRRGFFSQIITIAGVFIGLFLAYYLNDDLAPKITEIIGEHVWNNIIAFAFIFLAVLVLTLLINKISKATMENMGNEGVDKILGFIFGLVQGLVICITLTAMLTMQPFIDPNKIFQNSIIGNRIIKALPGIEEALPQTDFFEIDRELGA